MEMGICETNKPGLFGDVDLSIIFTKKNYFQDLANTK
jgi:hypothetical protein